MMKRIIIIALLIVIFISGITYLSLSGNLIRLILFPFRANMNLGTKDGKMSKDLYTAVYTRDTNWVKELLEKGADPNNCKGECGWVDSNPLNILSELIDSTYLSPELIELMSEKSDTSDNDNPIYQQLLYAVKNQNNPQDIHILDLLVKAGADINRRPYIWNRVNKINNWLLDNSNSNKDNPIELKKEIDCYVKDSNRLIEAFIKAGADPDMKGHQFPFSSEGMDARITDDQAKEYFAKGSRPINAAIEKGIIWESQVDLLLKYTKLDEESLKASERSKDPRMIEKISKLWKVQISKK
jgi:hypothetical protein